MTERLRAGWAWLRYTFGPLVVVLLVIFVLYFIVLALDKPAPEVPQEMPWPGTQAVREPQERGNVKLR